jgi:hypothetical protein
MEVYISRDMGKTWELATTLSRKPFSEIGEGTMSMTQLSDGRLLYPIARFTHPDQELFVDKRLLLHSIYVSTDGGKTFPVAHSTFCDVCETQVLELQSGRLLAAFRYQRDRYPDETFGEIMAMGGAGPGGMYAGLKIGGLVMKNVFLGDSDDGVTWENFRPLRDKTGRVLLGFGECYGRLVQVPDGRVVLVHDNRFPLEQGDVRARVSQDGGQTWDSEIYYLSLGRGYPSSVVLKDGTIVTITGNTSYTPRGRWILPWRAQVIRWKLP